MKVALGGLLLILVGPVSGADLRYQLSINHIGDDDLGVQLVYRLKEEVRKSATISLASNDDDAFYSIDMMTMSDDERTNDPSRTVYSLSFTMRDPRTGGWVSYNSRLGISGRERITETASDLIVWATKNVEEALLHRFGLLQQKCMTVEDYKKGPPNPDQR